MRLRALLVLSALSSACGSKGAVALTAHIENPSLGVQQAALGTGLSGGFDLVLDLGEYADKGSDVSLSTFSIAQGGVDVVPTLELAAGGTAFPVRVEPGKNRRVTLTLGGTQTYDATVGSTLCGAPVTYHGAVTDTGNDNKPSAVVSNAFTATCP